jgi:hypothetical protein
MQNTTSYQKEAPPPDKGSACPEGNHGGAAQVYSGDAGWQNAGTDPSWRDGTPEFQGSNVDTAPISTPVGASDNFTGGGQLQGD